MKAIGDKKVITELRKNLDSKNTWTKIYSKMAIKRLEILGLQGEARLDFLKNTLNDKQFEVNQWAVQELGKEIINDTVNKTGALEILKKTAKDGKTAGNYSASKMLMKLIKLGKISEDEIK